MNKQAKRKANTPPTDAQVMEANARGMDAFDDNGGIHDNPYRGQHIDLVNAWHEGFCNRHDRSGE